MNFEFNLCPNCLGRYRTLRLDSACKYVVVPRPFNSLVWPDEHPDQVGYFNTCCTPCRESIRLLAYARTHRWRYGELPEALVELWNKAQSMIPDWPGFKRLSLNDTQIKDLSTCPEQFDVAMGTVATRPDPFLQYLEKRKKEVPGLVRPGCHVEPRAQPFRRKQCHAVSKVPRVRGCFLRRSAGFAIPNWIQRISIRLWLNMFRRMQLQIEKNWDVPCFPYGCSWPQAVSFSSYRRCDQLQSEPNCSSF